MKRIKDRLIVAFLMCVFVAFPANLVSYIVADIDPANEYVAEEGGKGVVYERGTGKRIRSMTELSYKKYAVLDNATVLFDVLLCVGFCVYSAHVIAGRADTRGPATSDQGRQ